MTKTTIGPKEANMPNLRELGATRTALQKGAKTLVRTATQIALQGKVPFDGGTIAPQGTCPWCDNRRALNAAGAKRRRAAPAAK